MPQCIICQKEFTPRPNHTHQVTCGAKKCKGKRAAQMAKIRYYHPPVEQKHYEWLPREDVERFEYYCPRCKDNCFSKLLPPEAICVRCGYGGIIKL
jgi:hypothetical protein